MLICILKKFRQPLHIIFSVSCFLYLCVSVGMGYTKNMAAAYAALLSLTHLIEELLDNDQQPPYPISLKKKKILEALLKNLNFLLDLFHQDDHLLNNRSALESLGGRIRDAAYQTEDFIESRIVDRISSEYNDDYGWRRLVSNARNEVFHLTDTMFKAEEKGFKRFMKEIESIVGEAKKIMKSSRFNKDLQQPFRESSATAGSSRLEAADSKKMVFIDEDITKIKDWLCGESSRLQIVSIVGMGGAGKTTLAKHIFDDSLIVYHFHKRAWVTISQEYREQDILLGLLSYVNEKLRISWNRVMKN